MIESVRFQGGANKMNDDSWQKFLWLLASLSRRKLFSGLIIELRYKKNPVFKMCDQVRFKLACSATYMFDTISRQQITKALIRLCGYSGWFVPLLFALGKNRFCHDTAHIIMHLWKIKACWDCLVSLSRMLQSSSEELNKMNDGGPQFAEVFVIYWVGAVVVTLNTKLLGGNM